MKIKNSIFMSDQIAVINELIKKPLEITESYKLVKFVRELTEKQESFNEAKMKIFEKYGKLNEKEGTWEIKKKKDQELAEVELNKLVEIEEEYELESKINLPEDIKLSAAELIALEDIVEIPK